VSGKKKEEGRTSPSGASRKMRKLLTNSEEGGKSFLMISRKQRMLKASGGGFDSKSEMSSEKEVPTAQKKDKARVGGEKMMVKDKGYGKSEETESHLSKEDTGRTKKKKKKKKKNLEETNKGGTFVKRGLIAAPYGWLGVSFHKTLLGGDLLPRKPPSEKIHEDFRGIYHKAP